MVTLGIDFASQPANTAACFILWQKGCAELERLQVGVTNEDILEKSKRGIATPKHEMELVERRLAQVVELEKRAGRT